MTPTRTILYAGTYERDYPRNQQLIRLLRQSGCEVVEIHSPFWERIRDKSRGIGGPFALIQLFRAYLSLLVRFVPRLWSADAVAIGYIGQLDMLLLGSVARFARRPVLFNPLVTLTDTVVEDRRLTADSSLMARLFGLIDYVALRIATAVIVDTPQNADYLLKRFQVRQNRIRQIDVGADEKLFRPAPEQRLENSAELRILFYGKMIPLHGVETILESIAILQANGTCNFHLEIVGSGQLEHLVHTFRACHPTAPVNYRPWVAYSRLPQRIASSDCVLGVFGGGAKAGRVVPNKVFQAMAMGAPIITCDSPAVRRVLTDRDSALLVPPEEPEALADAIEQLQDPDLRGRLGRNARAAFEEWGSDTALSLRVKKLLDEFVPKRVSRKSSGRAD